MKPETLDYLTKHTGIPRQVVLELSGGRGCARGEGAPGSRARANVWDEPWHQSLPAVSRDASPYDQFTMRQVAFKNDPFDGCSHVRDTLPPLLAVIDEWRSADPSESQRPRCRRCKRAGRSPFCLKCEGVR